MDPFLFISGVLLLAKLLGAPIPWLIVPAPWLGAVALAFLARLIQGPDSSVYAIRQYERDKKMRALDPDYDRKRREELDAYFRGEDIGSRAGAAAREDEGAGQLIILIAALFGVIALLAMWVDKRAEDSRNHLPELAELSDEDLERMTVEELQALLDREAARKQQREEAAIMARHGIDPKDWEFMTPEERALFK